jgi:hypothetical protein
MAGHAATASLSCFGSGTHSCTGQARLMHICGDRSLHKIKSDQFNCSLSLQRHVLGPAYQDLGLFPCKVRCAQVMASLPFVYYFHFAYIYVSHASTFHNPYTCLYCVCQCDVTNSQPKSSTNTEQENTDAVVSSI